jgi:hypothetical protein
MSASGIRKNNSNTFKHKSEIVVILTPGIPVHRIRIVASYCTEDLHIWGLLYKLVLSSFALQGCGAALAKRSNTTLKI